MTDTSMKPEDGPRRSDTFVIQVEALGEAIRGMAGRDVDITS
jgi:hypothetical protein